LIVDTSAEATKSKPRSRVLALILFLNFVLLAFFLYNTFGRSLTSSGGVAIALTNETFTPMIGMSLRYPGGKLDIPRLNPKEQVGHPIPNVGEFDATLTFKDAADHDYKETFHVKPLGDNLILLFIQPVLEESAIKTADGKEEKVLKASPTKVRILTSYQGPVIFH